MPEKTGKVRKEAKEASLALKRKENGMKLLPAGSNQPLD